MTRPQHSLPLRLALGTVAVTLVLSACGGDDGDGGDGVTTAASDTSSESAPIPAPFSTLSAADGIALVEARGDSLTIVDVRTPAEYDSGHLPDAVLVDFEDPAFASNLEELDKDGAYAVYCRSGRRSALALEAMRQAGFTEVYDLGGIGVLQAAGMEVVTG